LLQPMNSTSAKRTYPALRTAIDFIPTSLSGDKTSDKPETF
jgi:hypothetical protein